MLLCRRPLSSLPFNGDLNRARQPHTQLDRHSAGPEFQLLFSSKNCRGEALDKALANDQSTYPFWPITLVTRDAAQIRVPLIKINRNAPNCLGGICVKNCTVAMGDCCGILYRQNGTHFVVYRHQCA